MARRNGFGWVSRAERRAADAFFSELQGASRRRMPRARLREQISEGTSDPAFFEGFGEAFGGPDESTGTPPMSIDEARQWVRNNIVSDAGRRPAPLGPAWVRRKLATGAFDGQINMAAAEIQRLDGQRINRRGTDYRVDTGQSAVFTQASRSVMPGLERIDTSATTSARCPRTFSTTGDLATRKSHWRSQIDTLASTATGKAALLDWIVGKATFSSNPTIQAATTEANGQIECMRRAINRVRSSAGLANPNTRGPTRDFDTQLCIWMWKYAFKGTRSGLRPPCSSTSATFSFGSMREDTVAAVHAAMSSSRSHFSAGSEWQPTGSSARTTAHRTAWTTTLTGDQREKEILQTSSAPGISRHHWGTDVDYASVSPSVWLSDRAHQNLYTWLGNNALAFGMAQVYTPDRPGYTATTPRTGYNGYIEERWHWSYYPVAQALLEWSQQASSKRDILARLRTAWNDVRTGSGHSSARSTLGWTSTTNPFHYIESHWEDFVFNVNRYVTPPVV